MTGLGEVRIQVPKTRDRHGRGRHFTSALLPPYIKRTASVESVLPWLYLKGVSTGDMSEALTALLGEQAKGLSAGTVSRLKQAWEQDYQGWCRRDLTRRRYVYVWADGIYFRELLFIDVFWHIAYVSRQADYFVYKAMPYMR